MIGRLLPQYRGAAAIRLSKKKMKKKTVYNISSLAINILFTCFSFYYRATRLNKNREARDGSTYYACAHCLLFLRISVRVSTVRCHRKIFSLRRRPPKKLYDDFTYPY